MELTTKAEQYALKAENLSAFHGIKLSYIKEQVGILLSHIGDNGIFDEYTKHDITHVEGMLNLLEKIIPQSTQDLMTPADWLMIVLAVYFHDVGMIVTKDEFNNRTLDANFVKYYEDVFSEVYGLEYKQKIEALDVDMRDRFLFQEFVRQNHGKRVAKWIRECYSINSLSEIKGPKRELYNILSKIDSTFLDHLAMICQSHLEDDLNLEKFKVDQAYGQSDDEVVNLLYAAIILRTADLLHVTSERTPSTELRLINPSDPVSQLEWAKQREVKSIKPQFKFNKEGNIDSSLQMDSFEIQAIFKHEEAYFAFIAYIEYAKNELIKSANICNLANLKFGKQYMFPWKNIDVSRVEAIGFEKRKFSFELDQNKILDLLIGHTLYNDSTVVLRELTQNGIDATRLKKCEKLGVEYEPLVQIKWNSKERKLYFSDNGTGMDYDIIQNHLLKVGSSRYQDVDFKKKYPNFSSISRFGIGLLTCFLIADNIDIYTKTEEMPDPLLLKIRKIHGSYLLRYGQNNNFSILGNKYGTTFVLHIRPDVDMKNIESDLRKWIILPETKVDLVIDEAPPLNIGYQNVKQVLKNYLDSHGIMVDDKLYRIFEYEKDGLQIAFLLKYYEYFQQWSLVDYNRGLQDDDELVPIGTCIEGIRVDFLTPGYIGKRYFAIANCIGIRAPKTNVARTNIENTREYENMLANIYNAYLSNIEEQIAKLIQTHSISWAANEANYLLSDISNYATRYNLYEIVRKDIFNSCLSNINCLLIENKEERTLTNFNDLSKSDHFWTVESFAYTSADSMLRDIKGAQKSALYVMDSILGQSLSNHINSVLCNTSINKYIKELLFDKFDIFKIRADVDYRRLDLCWGQKQDLWFDVTIPIVGNLRQIEHCFVQKGDIELENIENEIAIISQFGLFILKGTPLHSFLLEKSHLYEREAGNSRMAYSLIVGFICTMLKQSNIKNTSKGLDRFITSDENILGNRLLDYFSKEEILSALSNPPFDIYDTTRYYRKDW